MELFEYAVASGHGGTSDVTTVTVITVDDVVLELL